MDSARTGHVRQLYDVDRGAFEELLNVEECFLDDASFPKVESS